MDNKSKQRDLIFASYNRQDVEAVHAIQGRLERQGISLWLDTQKLRPGIEWMEELEAVILRSRAAVIFKGPHGFGNFQREEVSALFKLHADQELVVIPVLLPGASGKNAGLFLGNIHHVDFRLRSPDPLQELVSGLTATVAAEVLLMRPSDHASGTVNPLVQWIVNDMDNLQEIERYGRGYIEARRWPEALYIYHRLANLAISKSNRAYADSYLQIGRIHFLAGERDIAEKKWEVSLRIYRDYFPGQLTQVEGQLNSLRNRAAAYSPAG